MAPRRIIIDTDPGIDDVLAMLLAFAALPEELEILLISVTYGNTDIQNALRNTIALFHQVEREIAWRQSRSDREIGFDALRKSNPIVAVGPDHPLMDEMLMKDFFHGEDGLGGIHNTHPHLSPTDTWKNLFATVGGSHDPANGFIAEELKNKDAIFRPSREPGASEILRLLRENESDSITIVAVGPLTNLALAAAEDPETFLRVHEVVVMGGSIDSPGNITPTSEFNTFADSVAAARLYALTSPNPHTTMPPSPPAPPGVVEGASQLPPILAPYPSTLSLRLNITLFPLDITQKHRLTRSEFNTLVEPLLIAKSPLAEWVKAFMDATFAKMESLSSKFSCNEVGLSLHDPLCVWYCLTERLSGIGWRFEDDEDIRVETSGQWTRGKCVVDRRNRKRRNDDDDSELSSDHGNWRRGGSGNRIKRCVETPNEDDFGDVMMRRIFALSLIR